MLLDLKPILVTPGASLPFETREDLSDLVFGSCRPASEPILASGKVRNTAGVLELTGELSTTLHGVCDRCAGEFTRAVQIPVHAVLVSEEELEQTEDEWVFGIHDGCADLTDIITTAFVLNWTASFCAGPTARAFASAAAKTSTKGRAAAKRNPIPVLLFYSSYWINK